MVGCGPKFHPALAMQLKVWLVYKHPSRLRMQVKYPQVVYACVSLSFSVVVLKVVVSLLQCQIGKIVTWARKKELRDWRKNGSEDKERKRSHNLVKSARSKDSAWPSYEKTISSCSVRFETVVTSSNSFNIHFAIPSHFIHCMWLGVSKARATSINNNKCVGSKVIEMHMRHTLQIHKPSIYMFLCIVPLLLPGGCFKKKILTCR